MHYYPYPFKSPYPFKDNDDGRGGTDGHIDRLICLLVGLLCLAVLSAIVWP